MDNAPKGRLVVFHASFSKTPPHEMESLTDDPNRMGFRGGFHAGSEEAAKQRVQGLWKKGFPLMHDIPDSHSTMHAYEVDAEIDPTVYNDPMAKHFFKDSPRQKRGFKNVVMPEMPTDQQDKVLQYRNLYEDAGSTSYFIPKKLVEEGRVRHLSSQFVDPKPPKKPRKGSKAYEQMMKEQK